MNVRNLNSGPIGRSVCIILAVLTAMGPSMSLMAQTNAAQQAVRRRVEGVSPGPVNPEAPQREFQPQPGQAAPPSDPGARKIDTRFITPGAAAVIVLRPKQLMTSPIAQMLPTEVATAAGLQFVGFDPATVDELTIYVQQLMPPQIGGVVKFNQPFRAASLSPMVRPYAKLSQLGSKKYLQSANPMFPSFYGTNSQTLVVAPDATLRQLIEAPNPSASGPIVDRVRQAAWGSDLYIAIDVASVRPILQMGLIQTPPQAKEQAKKAIEISNLVSAVELTLNVASPGPTSLVIHGNDEAAAQQLEMMLAESIRKYQTGETTAAEQPMIVGPIQQAMGQYRQRISQTFQPQRNGTAITCFQLDGQNPEQRQLTSFMMGMLAGSAISGVQVAQEMARRAQGGGPAGLPMEGLPPMGEAVPGESTSPPVPPAGAPGEPERR